MPEKGGGGRDALAIRARLRKHQRASVAEPMRTAEIR